MKNKMFVSKNDQPKWPAWPEFDRSSLRSGRTLSVDQPLFSALKKLNRGQLLSPAACMLINKVSDDACQWHGHDVVISIGGIFLIEMPYMSHDTKKSWAFSDLVAAISAALHETFVRSKYANSVILFDNWRRFCGPSVIYVPVKCSPGGGLWSPEWTS